MERAITFKRHEEMPDEPITFGTTLVNKTGSWKYLRPVYLDKTPPCSDACPAGNDIEGVLSLMEQKEYEAAWRRLMWENPFPAITGRVCHHPCEGACNRCHFDEAVAIQSIERFLGDYAINKKFSVAPVREKSGMRVAVIGSGPAGLSAAYHLARLGSEVVLYEAMPELGGVLRYGIPEYRLPKYILNSEIERLKLLGVEFHHSTRVGLDLRWADLKSFDALFAATGVGRSRRLGIPGENFLGVMSGLELLRKINSGEPVELGERVAVIGGGNTAIDVARSVLRLGKSVQILYRRTRDEMPAIKDEIEEALHEGVKINVLTAPVKVLGQMDRVVGLELQRMELGEPDGSGRRRPVAIERSNYRIACDSIITAIGEEADLGYLPAGVQREMNVIHIDAVGRSTAKKIFAGGDVIDQPHTVSDAIGSGKRAAMAIDRFLQGGDLAAALDEVRQGVKGGLSMRRYVGDGPLSQRDNLHVVPFEKLNLNYFEKSGSQPKLHRKQEQHILDFGEVNRGFTDKMASDESSRCFHCGVCTRCDNCMIFCPDFAIATNGEMPYAVDYDYCKGCGICAYECPRYVIQMIHERSAP